MVLRHEKRLLQKSEINLGREGTAQAANFPELRNEIVALKKLEQEQKEVALRIARIEEGIKKIEEERQQNAREQAGAITKLEAEKKPLLQRRNQTKSNDDVYDRATRTPSGRAGGTGSGSPRRRRGGAIGQGEIEYSRSRTFGIGEKFRAPPER